MSWSDLTLSRSVALNFFVGNTFSPHIIPIRIFEIYIRCAYATRISHIRVSYAYHTRIILVSYAYDTQKMLRYTRAVLYTKTRSKTVLSIQIIEKQANIMEHGFCCETVSFQFTGKFYYGILQGILGI